MMFKPSLKLTVSLCLKNGVSETVLSLVGPEAYFQGRSVSFRECMEESIDFLFGT